MVTSKSITTIVQHLIYSGTEMSRPDLMLKLNMFAICSHSPLIMLSLCSKYDTT